MDSARAVAANAHLVLHEREARDRGWWDRMRDCYDRDAEIRVAWFQGDAAEFVNGSERMGAYVFGLRGYTINQQLPGDDRPGQVAALYQDAFTWAGLELSGPADHEGTGNVQHR